MITSMTTIDLARNSNTYKVVKDFTNDVRLVFNNARVFNRDDSYIYQNAEILSKVA